MKSVFKKKKLLQKGYPTVKETANPECVIWENLGQKKLKKYVTFLSILLTSTTIFACGFFLSWFFATFEKKRHDFVKNDCLQEDDYTSEQALADF